MSWLVFAIACWVMLGFELGAKDLLAIGPTAVVPSLLVPLGAFCALFAAPGQAIRACLIIGVLMDLSGSVAGSTAVVVGPHALGMLLGGQFVLSVRGMVIRRNPITIGLMSVFVSLLLGLVVVASYTVREMVVDDLGWHAGTQLAERLLSALYTGAAGIVVALVLTPAGGLFGFGSDGHGRGSIRRF